MEGCAAIATHVSGMTSPCNAQEIVLQLQSDKQSRQAMTKSVMKTSMFTSGLSQINPEMAILSEEIENMRTGAAKMAKVMDEEIKKIIKKRCVSEEVENDLKQKVHDMERHVISIEEQLRRCGNEIGSLHTQNEKLKSENERLTNENAAYKRELLELRQKKAEMQAVYNTMGALLGS